MVRPLVELVSSVGMHAVEFATQRKRIGATSLTYNELLCVVGLTIIAGLLRFHGLVDKSIWYDEAFVITLGQMPLPDMMGALFRLDNHPPLYYILMHIWLKVGSDPLTVRLPSVLLATASAPLLYVTGTRLINWRVALGATVLLVVSPFHIMWAQQARMYALLGFLCLGSTYFLVRAFQEQRRIDWVLHALLSAAALNTEIGAFFYLGAQGLAAFLLLARDASLRAASKSWVKSQAGVVLLFLPYFVVMLAQSGLWDNPGYAWTSVENLRGLLFEFGYSSFPYWRVPFGLETAIRYALVALPLLLTILGVRGLKRGIARSLVPFLFFGTIALLALVGFWRGVILPKTVLGASFAYFLLLCAGLATWRSRLVLPIGVVVISLLSLLAVARYYTMGPQEGWQEAVVYLSQHYQKGDVVFVDSSAGLMPMNYYLQREGHQIEEYGVPFKAWAVAPPPLSKDDFSRVDELSIGRSTIWLVIYRNGFPDPDGQLLPYLTSRYTLLDSYSQPKVRVYRFLVPHVYLGAWVGDRVNTPTSVAQFENAIGKRLSIWHRYSDNPPFHGQQFDRGWADAARTNGAIPMLSWQPGFGYGTKSLTSVAAGERDDYIKTWADQIRDWGHPIFLRMMWEQNSNWFAWQAYEEPERSDYIRAWRHIVEIFRSEGANNVTFVWSPHVSGFGASDILPTYPGDAYVDWVALDGYPYQGGEGDFVETFGPSYDLLVKNIDKPIMIAETGLTNWSDERKAAWIQAILEQQLPKRFPMVKALVWFDEKDTNGRDLSILQNQGPLSREAFRKAVATSFFATNQYGRLNATPIPPPDGEYPHAAVRGQNVAHSSGIRSDQ